VPGCANERLAQATPSTLLLLPLPSPLLQPPPEPLPVLLQFAVLWLLLLLHAQQASTCAAATAAAAQLAWASPCCCGLIPPAHFTKLRSNPYSCSCSLLPGRQRLPHAGSRHACHMEVHIIQQSPDKLAASCPWFPMLLTEVCLARVFLQHRA
jgi:hypothetical protein